MGSPFFVATGFRKSMVIGNFFHMMTKSYKKVSEDSPDFFPPDTQELSTLIHNH